MDFNADDLADYIGQQRGRFSDAVIRAQLTKDGLTPAQINAGFASAREGLELAVSGRQPGWRKWGVGALIGVLLAGSWILIKGSKNKDKHHVLETRTGVGVK